MFRWIFLGQAVIYLLLMPVLRSGSEFGYHPSLGSGILAIISLLAGYTLYKLLANKPAAVEFAGVTIMRPRQFLMYIIPVMIVVYAITVLAYGLLSRRQGSEFMAELYGQLPIYILLILRGYEILLVPIVLLYLFGGEVTALHRRVVIISVIVSLPFTGVLDSRSKLLIIALYITCFVKQRVFLSALIKYVRLYLVGLIVVAAFVFYSIERLNSYTSIKEFFLVEVYQRLDGLSLVSDLRDFGALDKIGKFDFSMFDPLLSRIPFLEAAKIAKMRGLTSSKQYYLQEILGRKQLDAPNSMIADPLYFAGWVGVIIAFTLLGYFIAKNDGFIKAGKLFRDTKNQTAISIAFVTSFVLIENDFVGAPLSFLQNYIFIVLFFMLGTTSRERSTRFSEIVVPTGIRGAAA